MALGDRRAAGSPSADTGQVRLARLILGVVAASTVLLGGVSPAWAGVGLLVAPNVPTSLVVGQAGVASTLTITNGSNGTEAGLDVTINTITLVPSCGTQAISGADCPTGSVDPGVLHPSPTGTGQTGTACQGTSFTTSVIDATDGKYEFTPSAPVVLGPTSGSSATCVIDFSVTVAKVPGRDADGSTAGLQTDQAVFVAGQASDSLAGSASGTNEVTIGPGSASLTTQVAPASVTVGSSFEDTATLTPPAGGVAPTGTIGFAVYGPADPGCTGTPAFTSTKTVAGAAAVSDGFTPSTAGTYRVIATYSGDADYESAVSSCADSSEVVSVNVPAPAITGLSPASGPAAGGTPVTITGTSLAGASTVHFGSAAVPATAVSATQVTATAPAGSGTVDVTVSTPGGTSPAVAADRYAYVPASAPPPGNPPPGPPGSHTGPPLVVTSLSAEFTATVNPEGLATTVHFEFTVALPVLGLTPIVLSARTVEQPVGSDFADHTVTATVASLLPNSIYRVRVIATNALGVTPGGDATFQTATDPPPPPVEGKTFNAAPVSGLVYVRPPGGKVIAPLTEARQFPVGTTFDTRRGVAELTSATATAGSDRTGSFSGGRFRLLQAKATGGLTELELVLASNARRGCQAEAAAVTAGDRAKRALPKTDLALLHSTVKGRFETRGRYSSATVRGTIWTTTDRCDGTLTSVHRGVVDVDDFLRGRTIAVRAGHAYLARAPS
jgi:hypothetical protein